MSDEESYAIGWQDGYRQGIIDAEDFVTAKTYDQAFSEGYRACREELLKNNAS